MVVLRCLVWVVTSSGSWVDVELAGQQIDHGREVSDGTVPASLCLGGLHQAVDPLDQPIGNLAVEPAQDAVPMTFDGMSGVDDRWQSAVGRPEVLALEESRTGCGGGLVIKVLECQADPIGPCGLEMAHGQVFEDGALAFG